jgi:hypothetical protein
MEKEYQFYLRLFEDWDNLGKSFDIVSDAIYNEAEIFIDIEKIKESCNAVLDFLTIRKRFAELSKCRCNLDCEKTGFLVDGHSFETLDEVERALKMKAFM